MECIERECMHNVNTSTLIKVATQLADTLPRHQDRDFMLRIYSHGVQYYVDRLKAMGFTHGENVLDAGCGFGQWSIALALLNYQVTGIDYAGIRLVMADAIVKKLSLPMIPFLQGSIESLPFESNSFDSIFSYSVIYQTDYKKTLQDIYRVLKPSGKVYFSTNDIGWYMYNIINNHNPSIDFNPRVFSCKTLLNTMRYNLFSTKKQNTDVYMPAKRIKKLLTDIGFRTIELTGEGLLGKNVAQKIKPIYASKYRGMNNVYEVIAYK